MVRFQKGRIRATASYYISLECLLFESYFKMGKILNMEDDAHLSLEKQLN